MTSDNRRASWVRSERLRALGKPIAISIYAGLNIGLVLYDIRLGPENLDWMVWEALPDAIAGGDMYGGGTRVPFVWSPIMGWLMAAVPTLGYWPWVTIHLAALVLLRSPLLIALTLVSWGFWTDVAGGNVFTFAFVAGVLALRGSRTASLFSVSFMLLMPRPVLIPLTAVVLWRQRDIWIPAATLFVAHAAVVIATGHAEPWVRALVAYGSSSAEFDIGLTHFIGPGWLLIGLPIAMILVRQGLIGWAGLAISPYLVPQYLLVPLVDLQRAAHRPGPPKSEPRAAPEASVYD